MKENEICNKSLRLLKDYTLKAGPGPMELISYPSSDGVSSCIDRCDKISECSAAAFDRIEQDCRILKYGRVFVTANNNSYVYLKGKPKSVKNCSLKSNNSAVPIFEYFVNYLMKLIFRNRYSYLLRGNYIFCLSRERNYRSSKRIEICM